MGMTKAAVFPEPVSAIPSTSRFCSAIGITCAARKLHSAAAMMGSMHRNRYWYGYMNAKQKTLRTCIWTGVGFL
jgi:hypothetical protein